MVLESWPALRGHKTEGHSCTISSASETEPWSLAVLVGHATLLLFPMQLQHMEQVKLNAPAEAGAISSTSQSTPLPAASEEPRGPTDPS